MGIAVWAWNAPVKSCCSEWSSPSWCGYSGGLGTFRKEVWLAEVGHEKQTLTVKLVPDSSPLPGFSPPCGHLLPSTCSRMNWVALTCHRTATWRNFWSQNKPFPTLCCEVFCYRGEEVAIEWASFLVCKNDNEVLGVKGSDKKNVLNKDRHCQPQRPWKDKESSHKISSAVFAYRDEEAVVVTASVTMLFVVLDTTGCSLVLEPWACLFFKKKITILFFSQPSAWNYLVILAF